MRREVVVGCTLVVGVSLGGTEAQAAAVRPLERAASAVRTVEYRGLRMVVPHGWPVYRLDDEPWRCVRFDRHAIYLGRPREQSWCPARVVGRTDALYVEPMDVLSNQRRVVRAGRLARYTVPRSAGHEVRLPLPEAGVAVTGSYGSDPAGLQSVIRTARLSAAPPSAERRVPPGRVGAAWKAPRRRWAAGKGFDTCAAPSLGAMWAWRRTYSIANIYIGGAARACAQPNLTRDWIRSVRRMGYRLIPTYVGLQAPCNHQYENRFTYDNAAAEGRRAADDAVARARALGIGRKKPIYFDIESYDSRKSRCREAVLRFMHHWTVRMKKHRYVSGVYSSAGSGIRDLGWATGMDKPKAIWFGHWDGKPKLYGSPYLPDWWWHPHRRIKQYRGGHWETHGGISLNVDSNIVDSRVY